MGRHRPRVDTARVRAAGAPVVQINTGTGCHLDAQMLARGLAELKPSLGSVALIENVDYLVCPACSTSASGAGS